MTSHRLARRLEQRLCRPFGLRRLRDLLYAVVGGAVLGSAFQVGAATQLADSPVFATTEVPGNVALALSVEWPTAVRTAHTDPVYAKATKYLGYFDPDKCYSYRHIAAETTTDLSYFYPVGLSTARNCTADGQWSGNYLNWAGTPTIDPFRWAMTGGYRIIDTTSLTVLQKARHSGQGGLTPNKSVTVAADVASATPLAASNLYTRIQGLGVSMRFTALSANTLNGRYFNGTNLSGGTVLSRDGETVNFAWGGSPGGEVNADNFSARWTGTHVAPATGTYSFQTVSDDGVRLYINNTLIINNWTNHASTTNTATVTLTAGQQYEIKLEYFEATGGAEIRLRWQPPGATDFMLYSNPLDNGPFTAYDPAVALGIGKVYEVRMRNRVCDPSDAAGGVEANCKRYGSNWKPEGLVQQYSDKIRFSAFGYLNDGDMLRDGAVLRAQQKFVGPTMPVPGQPDIDNEAAEWDPTTGVFITNPDPDDATQTNADFSPGTSVTNSGVVNYLNKFGQLNTNNYKDFDPVSELYYTALRYLKNQGSVSEYTAMSSANEATRTRYLDGFPAITRWNDPIQYSCQKNFILGIGDIYTHRDKNLPGATGTTDEPTKPAAVTSDTSINTVTLTNKVFELQGLASPNINSYSGRNNSAGIAGMAYYANTKDIRPDVSTEPATKGKQTVKTYWVDVLEAPFVASNQFYLAAKFGGFAVPDNFDPDSRTTALPLEWWSTTGEMVGTQNRPDNYFTAGRPDTMVTGLTQAFADIAGSLEAFTTSFSTSVPQVAVSGNGSYSALYSASNWSGEVQASELSFNADGDPSLEARWTATSKLATQLAGTGWNTERRVVTWSGTAGVAFRAVDGGAGRITDAQLATLDTSYRAGNDSVDYLNYLRGERAQEQGSTVTGSSKAYRTREKLLGDIVGSRARPVGPPSLPLSDATNPGYSAFKNQWKDRPTVVYAGANDGMMHAFDGRLTGTNAGSEIFAYVPSVTFEGPTGTPGLSGLASLGKSPLEHHYFVNATPTVFDIDLGKTWSGASVGTTTNWRSVLIGGLGKGGRSYYAIDVTDPASMTTEAAVAGKVLWEFTAPEMGYTFGEPVVVKTRKYGWTVILPSGYNNADGRGYLFFVNPRTGALLEKVTTGEGSATDDAGLAHANGYVLDFTDGYVDAIYAGDLLGNLWRADVTSTTGNYPAPTKLASLVIGGTAQPVTSRPIMELHPKTRKRVVMVGTGRLLDSSDISSTQEQSFYAINDGTSLAFNKLTDLPEGVDFPIERDDLVANTDLLQGITVTPDAPMGWYVNLGKDTSGVAWRIVSDPTTFFGTVAFAPVLPSGDPCSPSGTSRIYGVDFSTGISRLKDVNGTLVSYVTGGVGVVTDLRFLSVGGKVRLVGGTDRGEVKRVPGEFGSSIGLRRLNWRELPVAN